MRYRFTWALAAPLALALVACGDDSESAAPVDPLAELFGGNISPAEQRAMQLAVEEATAECMRDLGWEYIPVDYTAQFGDGGELDWTDPDFGEKWGYGVVKGYELYELPSLNGEGQGPGQEFVDPNQEYVQSLNEDDMNQYYEDLYGPPMEEPVMEGDATDATAVAAVEYQGPQGCSGKAQEEVYGEQPWNNPTFSERYSELSEDMMNDPRIEDATADWSDCMWELSEDYDFVTLDEARMLVERKMYVAKGQEVVPADPETGMPIGADPGEFGWSSWTDGNGDTWAAVGEPQVIPDDELKTLLAEELKVWKDDHGCQTKAGVIELQRQLSQEVADTLRAEFPELFTKSNG